MNLLMADVGHVEGVGVGDEVVLLGRQGREEGEEGEQEGDDSGRGRFGDDDGDEDKGDKPDKPAEGDDKAATPDISDLSFPLRMADKVVGAR